MDSLLIVVPGGAGVLLILVVVAFLLLKGRVLRLEQRGDDQDKRIGRNEERADKRMRTLEDALVRSPSRDDFERLDARLDHLDRSHAVLTEQLRAASAGIGRIEDYMIHKGAKDA